jgi:hypothetical protein
MAFASVSDLATHLRTDLSAEDTATATQALDLATAFIKTYCGQELEAVDNRVQVFRAQRCTRTLILDELPVRAIDSVTVDAVAFTDYDVDLPAGIITRNDLLGAGSWNDFEKMIVTYDSGYSTIPTALKAICLQLAARNMAAPTAFASEAVGNYSRTSARDSEGGLTMAERRVLDRFRP